MKSISLSMFVVGWSKFIMDEAKILVNGSSDGFITEENKNAVISQANIVKQDIDQLLMYLGANRDINTITKKMDQLGQNIADLYTYIHSSISVTQRRTLPRHSGGLSDFV